MKPFEIKSMQPQDWSDKVFKREPSENYAVEINNLLALVNFEDTPPGYINSLKKKYNIKNYSGKTREIVKNLFIEFAEYYLDNPSEGYQSKDKVKKFADFLQIEDHDFHDIFQQIAEKSIKFRTLDLVSDKEFSEADENEIERLRIQFALSQSKVTEIVKTVLQSLIDAKVTEITSDKKISPDEENSLFELIKNLNMNIHITSENQKAMDKMKELWNIENGPLPNLPTDIFLQRNESCVFQTDADLYEMRKITKRVNYGGPSVRIKIMKGVYYRVGNMSGNRVTEDKLTKIDSGNLYITNKRILYVGSMGNKPIRYNQIIDFEVYTDGIKIVKESGKDPLFAFKNDNELAGAYIARCLSQAN